MLQSAFHLVWRGRRVTCALISFAARPPSDNSRSNSSGGRFRNTEIITLRNGKITEVEVYFGWSIPHEAKPGGFINP